MSWFQQNADDSYRAWLEQEQSLGRVALDQPTPAPVQDGTNGAALPPVAGGMAPQVETGGGQYPLSSVSGDGLMRPWTTAFTAPTGESVLHEPGYKFGLDEGLRAIERMASARGTYNTAAPVKAGSRYAVDYASTKYNDAYNRLFGEYRTAHDIYKGNQQDQFNRLSSLAGTGQTAANTLGSTGSSYAQMGSEAMTGAGNALAAGKVGAANAWQGAIGNLSDTASLLAILRNQNQGR
jgi:hypothetical protein